MKQTLYRIHRPQRFSDVIGQEAICRILQHQLKSGSVAHAYLFTGPRGVGKTTAARLLARAVNCEALTPDVEPCNTCGACTQIQEGKAVDLLEMDAASHTGVDDVREQIIESIRFAPTALTHKIFIIDEVHMLSTSAFNALLKTLEEPPTHAIFILATTELHKVPATIISRCQRFDFRRVGVDLLTKRLMSLVNAEGMKAEEETLRRIAQVSGGCVRDAESLLGQVMAIAEEGKIEQYSLDLLLPDEARQTWVEIVEAISHGQTREALLALQQAVTSGADLLSLLDGIGEALRALLFLSAGEPLTESWSEEEQKRLTACLPSWSSLDLTYALEHLLAARRARHEFLPTLPAEIALTRIALRAHPSVPGPTISSSPSRSPHEQMNPRGSDSPITASSPPTAETSKTTNDQRLTPPHPQPPEAALLPSVNTESPLAAPEEILTLWPQVLSELQRVHATLPLVLQTASVSLTNDGLLQLSFAYALHAETMNREKHLRLLEGILERVMGRVMKVRAVYAKAPEEQTLSQLASAFGAV